MYIRPVHAELDPETLHALIRANPLGLLTTAIPHPTHATIQTSHVPFVLDVPDDSPLEERKGKGKRVLRGHMARANPQVKAMIHTVTQTSYQWRSQFRHRRSWWTERFQQWRRSRLPPYPSPHSLPSPHPLLHYPQILHLHQTRYRKSSADMGFRRCPDLRPSTSPPPL